MIGATPVGQPPKLSSIPPSRLFANFPTPASQPALFRRNEMMSPNLRTILLATLLTSTLYAASGVAQSKEPTNVPHNYNEMTVAQLEALMAAGKLTSEKLTDYYIDRILDLDQNGPGKIGR